MRVQVAGRHIDLGEALKARINDDLERTIEKYFSRSGEAMVTVTRSGPGFEVDCSLHLPSGIQLQVEGFGGDAHGAFENALEKIEKRVRRYKRRLKNHHNTQKAPLPAEQAAAYIIKSAQADDVEEESLDGGEDGVSAEGAPLVIAETVVAVKTMSVSTAVLQLDISDSPAFLFRNAANGGLNLVYRRKDGNIGWVDPERVNGAAR